MTAESLHYLDYTRDAIKLVVEGIELEGDWGREWTVKGGEGPHVEMWQGPPATLRRHWPIGAHYRRHDLRFTLY